MVAHAGKVLSLGLVIIYAALAAGCRVTSVHVKASAKISEAEVVIDVEVKRDPCPCPCPPPDASSLFETREVDPLVFSDKAGGSKFAVARITLSSGQIVSYSQALVLDPGTAIPPSTPGNHVLVYRPADTLALQTFIDTYWADAVAVETSTSIELLDVSGGTTNRSTVEVHQGLTQSQYVGGVVVVPPTFEKERHVNL